MTITTVGEGLDAAKSAVQNYREQASELQKEIGAIDSDLSTVQGKINSTVANLTTGILPYVKPETLQQAIKETGALFLMKTKSDLDLEYTQAMNRRTEIENDPRFKDRELLNDPMTGNYTIAIREDGESIAAITPRIQEYESRTDFQLMYRRRNDPPQSPLRMYGGTYGSIIAASILFLFILPIGTDLVLSAVALAVTAFILDHQSRTREKKQNEIVKGFHQDSLQACFDDYEHCRESAIVLQQKRAETEELKQTLDALINEHANLVTKIDSFPGYTYVTLKQGLYRYLLDCEDYKDVHKQIRQEARVSVATIIALKDKATYLEKMRANLQKEKHDRENRASAIERVASKWRRKSRGTRLRGDKSGWLIDGPQRARRSTTQRVTLVHTMHTNVVVFNDYDLYDRALINMQYNMLTYDLIARTADERMPYDAFACQVIPDIAEYRAECGVDRPNYGQLDQVIGVDGHESDPAGDAALAAIAGDEAAHDANSDVAMTDAS